MNFNEIMKDLNSHAQVQGHWKKPKVIIQRIDRMYENGVKCLEKKEFRPAYVYLKRWSNCVVYLKTQNLNKELIANHFSNNRVEKVEIYLKDITLEIKREANNKEFQIMSPKDNAYNASEVNSNLINSLQFPDTPNDEPQPKEMDEITCSDVFQILNTINENDIKRILVIDVRKDDDFFKSQISFQKNVIHISQEIIQRNKTAKDIEFYLNHLKENNEDFNRFHKMLELGIDVLVLMDSNSAVDTIKIESPIHLFQKTLKDAKIQYKRLAILKGGFENWINTYPKYVISSQTEKDISKNSMSNTLAGLSILDTTNHFRQSENSLPPNQHPYRELQQAVIEAKLNTMFNVHTKDARDQNSKEAKGVLGASLPLINRNNKPNHLTKIESKRKVDTKHSVNEKGWNKQTSENEKIHITEIQSLRVHFDEKSNPKSSINKSVLYPELHLTNKHLVKPNIIQQKLTEQKEISDWPEKMSTEEEIYIQPIKNENLSMNSGLKRSYSSPNLMQNDGSNRIPEINRSLKPSITCTTTNNRRKSNILSSDREAALEPVYCSQRSTPGITGLKNLGNSCFMNSIIQCLSNTVHLANYFRGSDYVNHLNKNIDKGAANYVAMEFALVIQALWSGQYKSISPHLLKAVIGQYKAQFANYDQQDSHEFLTFLLDWMHDDLKQVNQYSNTRPLTVAEKEWEKAMGGQNSVISKLFFGQLRSTIECLNCKENSTTYETFNSLTVSLPASRCTLNDCIQIFASGQRVSGWKCSHCKIPRDGIKKFDIAKLPRIIVIHLNRFGETSGWIEKKNTAVDFPLTDFNLKSYLVQEALDNFSDSNYNLYAMSNHYGTMDGGHYTAYCKSDQQKKWYKYDDHTVTEVHQSDVKNQSNSAYLLFYASSKIQFNS